MPNQRKDGVTPRTVALPDVLWERAVAEGPSASAVVRIALEEHFGGESPDEKTC